MKHLRIGFITGMIVLILSMVPLSAVYANLPYSTTSSDVRGRIIPTPSVYLPNTILKGFKSPEDIFMMDNDEMYVVDSGDNRVVHLDPNGNILGYIPSPLESKISPAILNSPEGIYVAGNELYVADTGKRRIAIFDLDGNYLREMKQPVSQYLPKKYLFVPSKIAVDIRGYVYVANKGGYQGLLQLTSEGKFAGFFGANKVPADFVESIKRKFYTEEQLEEEAQNLPGAITNLTLDKQGFIYTVNRDLKVGQLKRLNSGGVDIFGGINFAPWLGFNEKFSFQDVAVDKDGFITTITSSDGRIYQYDPLGDLIFRFGSYDLNSQREGMFKRPTAVAVNSHGDLFVADGELNMIQVFKPTEFGKLVHNAITLDRDGKYDVANPMWKRILELNGRFDRAYQGIAKAEYKHENYKAAMQNFETSFDKQGYSDSYWEVRMNSLVKLFGIIMTLLIALWIAWMIYQNVRKRRLQQRLAAVDTEDRTVAVSTKSQNSWVVSLTYIFRILRHPVTGMYDLVEDSRTNLLAAIVLVLLGFVVNMSGKYYVSFIFAFRPYRELDLKVEAGTYFILLFGWIVGNYLIGSIMKGEGTFRKVFIVNAYALVPYIIFTLPIQWLSNVLTLQESVIYSASQNGIMLWVLLLMFIGSQTVHNYNLKEALGMTVVSLFTMMCMYLFGFILVILFYQAYDFIFQVGRELNNYV